ncbi:hypothetical protein ACFX1Q_030120 [Malus domestica]
MSHLFSRLCFRAPGIGSIAFVQEAVDQHQRFECQLRLFSGSCSAPSPLISWSGAFMDLLEVLLLWLITVCLPELHTSAMLPSRASSPFDALRSTVGANPRVSLSSPLSSINIAMS